MEDTLTGQIGQTGDMTYRTKKGNQQAIKDPIIIPENGGKVKTSYNTCMYSIFTKNKCGPPFL